MSEVAMKAGYKWTEVGEIPEEWNVRRVGESFDVCNHLRLPISQAIREQMAGPYPYYGPTSIQGWINKFRVEGVYALIGEDGDHYLKWRNQPMTLLVRGKFNVNNHAHLVHGSKNLTDWFYWFFSNRDITQYLTRQGAGRYKLTKKTLVEIPCPIPPLPEQRAIAAALSDMDALIDGLDQLIAKKRDLKQAAMQQLLTGQRRLPGFCGKWEVKRLGDIATCYSGGTPPTGVSGYYNGDIPWITSSDLNKGNITAVNGRISQAGLANSASKMIDQDTLLIALYGATSGVTAISKISAAINQAVLAIIPKSHNTDFLYFKLQYLKDWLISTCTQGGQPNLSGEIVKSIELPMPSVPEQYAIAAVLTDMDAEFAALEARRDKAIALKQGMMQELLTGRIRLIDNYKSKIDN